MIRLIFLIATTFSLTGCIGLALAPLAPMVGGMASSDNKVEIDPATVTPELRQAFVSAKSLTVLANDPATTYFAQYMDAADAYEVRTEEPKKGATPSQRREVMRNICTMAKRPDLVLSSARASSDADSGGSNAAAFLTGRAIVEFTSTADVLDCRNGIQHKFSTKTKLNQGFYNLDKSKVNEVLGNESAKAVMRMAGKLADGPVVTK